MQKMYKCLLMLSVMAFFLVFPCFGVHYVYDGIGRVQCVSYDGLEVFYTYDESGNIKSIRKQYLSDVTIEFDSNGGSNVQPITARPNDVIYEPEQPERLGYIFLGWFTDKECTKKYIFDKMPARNLTLYAGWSNDENYDWYILNPDAEVFEIYTEEQLVALSKIVSQADNFDGKVISIQNDITLSKAWVPIGTEYRPFNGTFSGGVHTIAQVKVNSSKENSVGFFGVIGANAIIKDLKLSNANIVGNDIIGSIAGINNGLIINCSVEGSVTGNTNIGGIVGKNNGDIVNIQSHVDIDGNDFVGGAVGTNDGNVLLCVVTVSLNEFKTDNFGTLIGYASGNGHAKYSLYPSISDAVRILQAYGTNSIYDKDERASNAYYLYYERDDAFLPDVRSGYIAQLEYVSDKINNYIKDIGGSYKGIPLITWNEIEFNLANIPCLLDF